MSTDQAAKPSNNEVVFVVDLVVSQTRRKVELRFDAYPSGAQLHTELLRIASHCKRMYVRSSTKKIHNTDRRLNDVDFLDAHPIVLSAEGFM